MPGGFAYPADYALGRGRSTPRQASFLRHSEARTFARRYWNINQLCIGYSLRPRLSSRLTLSRRTLLRKPYPFGDPDSHGIYRYLSLDSRFQSLHPASRRSFGAIGTLSYRSFEPTISVYRLVPFIFGANSLDTSAITHCLNGGCL